MGKEIPFYYDFDEFLKIGTETASLDENQLTFLLEEQNPDNIHKLFAAANAVKLKNIGNKVSLRGLIEIGNICRKNNRLQEFVLIGAYILRMRRSEFTARGYAGA